MVIALWWSVLFSGLYHGLNPAMGWPLAVSAALMERKSSALVRSLALLASGHFLAMLVILLPFTLMLSLLRWESEIRIGAGLLVIAMGLYLLVNHRHPRILARVHPARLAYWSFLAATAHGAGLMLVPIYLGICKANTAEFGHLASQTLITGNISIALSVAVLHTLVMTLAGGLIAFAVYRWFGLKFLSSAWMNLDTVWALSLVCVGAFGVFSAL